MKRGQLIIISLFILAAIAGYSIYANREREECKKIDVHEVAERVGAIENNKTQYATTSRSVFGRSTDGGMQIIYSLNDKIILIEEELYGETVMSDTSYFLQDDRVFYFHMENTRYTRSIYSEDFDPHGKSVEILDYYLDDDQMLCFWYKNGKLQLTDQAATDLVNRLISELWE